MNFIMNNVVFILTVQAAKNFRRPKSIEVKYKYISVNLN